MGGFIFSFVQFSLLFSSPKVHVNYCHHLASVVLSSVNFSHFKLLLRNHWANWNQTSRNVPCMVFYKVSVFRSNRIFNIAPRANNMLWLAEISKISSLKLMNCLNPNCKWDHWNVLYQVSVFYADRKSKMAAKAGHRLTLDPMGKCSNAFFSETQIWLKPNYTWMFIGWSSTNTRFFVSLWNSKWRLRQDLV